MLLLNLHANKAAFLTLFECSSGIDVTPWKCHEYSAINPKLHLTAVFWVEYVIHHRGAHHMRSAARDLNVIQYYCLDIISAIAGVIALVLYILFVIIRKILVLSFHLFWKPDKEVEKQKQRAFLSLLLRE